MIGLKFTAELVFVETSFNQTVRKEFYGEFCRKCSCDFYLTASKYHFGVGLEYILDFDPCDCSDSKGQLSAAVKSARQEAQAKLTRAKCRQGQNE